MTDGRRLVLPYTVMEGYGGIWITGKPFVLNKKCVIIGLLVVAVYQLPRFAGVANLFMMAFLFSLMYIAISYYDYMYRCDDHMWSGRYSITGLFKPQRRGEYQEPPKGARIAEIQERAYLRSVYYAHTFIIAPLIMMACALAIKCKRDVFNERGTPSAERDYSVFPVVFGLAAVAFLYHGMRLIYPRNVSC